jgi:adenine deaminase
MMDTGGRSLVPGLTDAHAHYKMSIMSAVPFAEAVLPRGTTAALIDCHDMVNVMGMEGCA